MMSLIFAPYLTPCSVHLSPTDKNDRPIAKRYYTGTEPWKVTIPLEDIKTGDVLPHATITLELSAIKWLYK